MTAKCKGMLAVALAAATITAAQSLPATLPATLHAAAAGGNAKAAGTHLEYDAHPDDLNPVVKQLAAEFRQWTIGSDRSGPALSKARFEDFPDRGYNLKNARTHEFLQWEKETFGINLGWTDNGDEKTGRKVARWFFTREHGRTGAFAYGERVALGYGVSPSHLRYGHRTVGIDLHWSKKPVFEWKVLGGRPGTSVRLHKGVALFNVNAPSDSGRGEFLIHFDRTVGGDIGWPSSKTWTDKIKEYGLKLTERAVRAAVIAALSS